MFKTIKSTIMLISASMLLAVGVVLGFFAYIYLQNTETLMINSTYYSVSDFAQNLNKEIMQIEDNAKDLALSGKFFTKTKDDKKNLEFGVSKTFENYKNSLGGGLWFEPYAVNPYKRLFSVYAYRNDKKELIFDPEFEGEKYNYLNQKWYQEIKNAIKKEHSVRWSMPYYEHEGSNTLMVTAGAGIYDENNKLIGISTVDWAINSIIETVQKLRPTPNSFALFGDRRNDITIALTDPYLDPSKYLGEDLHFVPWYNDDLKDTLCFDYQNNTYIPYVKNLDNGMIFVVCIPKNELFAVVIKDFIHLFLTLAILNIFISYILYKFLKREIENPIDKLINVANKISEGGQIESFKIDKPEEFAHLTRVLNKMTKEIKHITQEKEKIASELSIAKNIQLSSLPNKFPPYPDRGEFEIYASMDAAKDVGGDFYDFYFLDKDKFLFLIADVSGKGIPAALFMMTAKTVISNIASMNLPFPEMIKEINNNIFKNNKQGFFVTAFICLADVKTGQVTCVNCGHNPPLLKKNNQEFKYLQSESNIVLGMFENFEFKTFDIKLEKGDMLFLYTDGVTEAMNKNDELYGEKRLLDNINNNRYNSTQEVIENIKDNVLKFADGNPQSDDITMLTYKFTEENTYKNIANLKLYSEFASFVAEFCKKEGLSKEITSKLEFVSEEIYTNVCSYAYPDNNSGKIEVNLSKNNDEAIIQFVDEGIPYNPLEKEDPDVELPIEERTIGGLGIFMVKNTAKKIVYEYIDNKNVLTITVG